MWPNPDFPADLVTFTEKSLTKNFISCAVSEELFVNRKDKNTLPWLYVISDLQGEDIVETFYKK